MDEVLRKFTLEFFGKGQHKITAERFLAMPKGLLLDVRTLEEVDTLRFDLKHHSNIEILNIPLDRLSFRIEDIPTDIPIAIMCSGTCRSTIAYTYLMAKGFSKVKILEGGYGPLVEAIKPGKLLKVLEDEKS